MNQFPNWCQLQLSQLQNQILPKIPFVEYMIHFQIDIFLWIRQRTIYNPHNSILMVDILPVIHCYQALFNTAIVRELIAFWFSPRIYCSEVSESQSYMRLPQWNTKCIDLIKCVPQSCCKKSQFPCHLLFSGQVATFWKEIQVRQKVEKRFTGNFYPQTDWWT